MGAAGGDWEWDCRVVDAWRVNGGFVRCGAGVEVGFWMLCHSMACDGIWLCGVLRGELDF